MQATYIQEKEIEMSINLSYVEDASETATYSQISGK